MWRLMEGFASLGIVAGFLLLCYALTPREQRARDAEALERWLGRRSADSEGSEDGES